MSFVVEVVKEAAKRRGMSYDKLIGYIKGERASRGLGEDNIKEVNTEMEEQTEEQVKKDKEMLEELAVKVELQEENTVPKTTGSVGNFGKPTVVHSQEGCLGERLGRMAVTKNSNDHYFQ